MRTKIRKNTPSRNRMLHIRARARIARAGLKEAQISDKYIRYSSLAPSIARFVRDIFERVEKRELNRQLIFLGRDATIFFETARAMKQIKIWVLTASCLK